MLARILIASTVLTLGPAVAAAQFTTFVPPNRPDAPTVAAQQTAAARADTTRRQTLSQMTAWVDSAAGTVAVSPVMDTTARDSVMMAADSVPADVAVTPATTEFREGARAPNTASSLPIVTALGTLLLVAGLWLTRAERKPSAARSRERR